MRIDLAVCLLLPLLFGCKDESVIQADAVGLYKTVPNSAGDSPPCFELHSDGTYQSFPLDRERGESVAEGIMDGHTWAIRPNDTGWYIVIGNSSLPIEKSRHRVRVILNDDLGYYCDKSLR